MEESDHVQLGKTQQLPGATTCHAHACQTARGTVPPGSGEHSQARPPAPGGHRRTVVPDGAMMSANPQERLEASESHSPVDTGWVRLPAAHWPLLLRYSLCQGPKMNWETQIGPSFDQTTNTASSLSYSLKAVLTSTLIKTCCLLLGDKAPAQGCPRAP